MTHCLMCQKGGGGIPLTDDNYTWSSDISLQGQTYFRYMFCNVTHNWNLEITIINYLFIIN